MTPAEYRALRKRLGTQAEVAELLGTTRNTVSRWELGKLPISRMVELAMLKLVDSQPEIWLDSPEGPFTAPPTA